MKIITQAQAVEFGLTRFYTSKPCIHGHLAERYTLSGECVECNKQRALKSARVRAEKLKAARARLAEVR